MGRKQRYREMAVRVFPYAPRIAVMLADRRARLILKRAEKGTSPIVPTASQLDDLFGPGGRPPYEEFARGCAVSQARSRLIKEIGFSRGLKGIQPLIDVEGKEHLDRLRMEGAGVILATWHSGPTPAVWASLLDDDVRLMKVQTKPTPPEHPAWATLLRREGPIDGLRVLKACSRHLKSGGWLGAAYDVNETQDRMRTVRYFGRAVPYPLGIPVLSVSTGAPVVTIVARWALEQPRIRVKVYEPLYWKELAREGGTTAEEAILERMVNQMESFFRAYPTELSRANVEAILHCGEMP